MLPSLYNGISGLQVHSRALTVASDNIANVNTVGFKNSRVSFANVYNRAIGGSAMEFGQGVDIVGVTSQWNSGSFQTTSNALDLAIGGRGMFTLADPSTAERFYSRDGQFKFDKEGYLVATNGMRVLGTGGAPIQITPFPGTIVATAINKDGFVVTTDNTGAVTVTAQRLELADFADYTGLAKQGRNLYSATNISGAAIPNPPGVLSNGLIAPGSLEMSNTDLASEFVNMISMQRGFQANSKTITTADQVLEVLMSVKR